VSMDDVLPRKPARDVELRHGYTLAGVNAVSVWAVMHDRYCSFADVDERLEVAWHAIVEHLYTAAEIPDRQELILTGWRAIREYVQKDARFRGYNFDGAGETRKGFTRYWTSADPVGPEERVTDYLALNQIWPNLKQSERELILALAKHEDYGLAAEAMGQPRHTYATEVGRAKRAFRELWHEGETVSGPWGADRRRRPGTEDYNRPSVTYRLTVRQRAKDRRGR
jgi:hypothetical protein